VTERRGREQETQDDDQSMLHVLDEPFVFTQRPALTVRAFCDELKKRRIDMFPRANELEAFHRAGLVVPIYEIVADPRAMRARARARGRKVTQQQIRAGLDATSTYGHELIEERNVGDLRLPAADGYVPWRAQRRSFAGRPYQTRQYLYSHYQLLLAPMIAQLWPQLQGQLGKAQRLRVSDVALKHHRATATSIERLVPILTVVEAVYLPDIVENVSLPGFHDDFEPWDSFRASFDAPATLSRLGWSADDVLATAEGLIFRGRTIDPAATLHEVVRLIHPSHWKGLEGDSLVAMDYRIAAELLLLFYEDVAKAGAAAPLDQTDGRTAHTQRHRLRTDRTELDTMLTRFGLSPHPAVVAVVEGEVEARIVPLVLDHLYGRRWRSKIRLFDAQGVDTPLGALAAFAAVPVPAESERDVIPLARHPTRFVVLSDAEGSNASESKREEKRQGWIDRIHAALPTDIRAEVDRSELNHLVQIIVWDPSGDDFERAHFTDKELAAGLLAVGPNGPPLEEVLRRLADVRARRLNLKRVWQQHWDAPKPSKPRLAMHLWPLLSKRIDEAREEGSTRTVPVLTAVREMAQLAYEYPRHWGVVMQRTRPHDEAESDKRQA
jgi:hypothetical protein